MNAWEDKKGNNKQNVVGKFLHQITFLDGRGFPGREFHQKELTCRILKESDGSSSKACLKKTTAIKGSINKAFYVPFQLNKIFFFVRLGLLVGILLLFY